MTVKLTDSRFLELAKTYSSPHEFSEESGSAKVYSHEMERMIHDCIKSLKRDPKLFFNELTQEFPSIFSRGDELSPIFKIKKKKHLK